MRLEFHVGNNCLQVCQVRDYGIYEGTMCHQNYQLYSSQNPVGGLKVHRLESDDNIHMEGLLDCLWNWVERRTVCIDVLDFSGAGLV